MEDGKESIIEGKRGCFTEGDRRSTVEFVLKIAIYRKLRKAEALVEDTKISKNRPSSRV